MIIAHHNYLIMENDINELNLYFDYRLTDSLVESVAISDTHIELFMNNNETVEIVLDKSIDIHKALEHKIFITQFDKRKTGIECYQIHPEIQYSDS